MTLDRFVMARIHARQLLDTERLEKSFCETKPAYSFFRFNFSPKIDCDRSSKSDSTRRVAATCDGFGEERSFPAPKPSAFEEADGKSALC
jgi:hypothetical protein